MLSPSLASMMADGVPKLADPFRLKVIFEKEKSVTWVNLKRLMPAVVGFVGS